MSMLLGPDGRPLGENGVPDLVDANFRPISSQEEPKDEPVEDFIEGGFSEEALERTKGQFADKTPLQPASVAAELIQKGRLEGLSASERKLLKMSVIANEMSIQNLTLWVALHGIAIATDVKNFTVTIEKLRKWGETHPSKWPINAARLQSGSIAFEVLDEIPEAPPTTLGEENASASE